MNNSRFREGYVCFNNELLDRVYNPKHIPYPNNLFICRPAIMGCAYDTLNLDPNCDSYIYEHAITSFDSRYDIRILTVDYEYNVKPRLDYVAGFRVDVNTFECQIQVYDYFI